MREILHSMKPASSFDTFRILLQ